MKMSDRQRKAMEGLSMGDTYRQDTYRLPDQMATDAGILDIGRRPYGPNEVPGSIPWGEDSLLISPYQSDIRATQGVNSMVANPERFSSAVSRMPPSENIEYGKPAGLLDWIRAPGWAVR